ncbi:chemotaxis protein MotB [Desulfovibrio litoralis DSM 11393]|uniref:Chemotaxis protein MotB n=2 Tax=Desulfovibrio litoralis TaxID=466107 RepID=A0A1M7TB40_9BACT|nr:chemotaxis protein MotB [Desulfovibrio litoralis DSM 11393]
MTYSDVMTLLLTFFVVLVSMSTIDSKRKREVFGSLSATFSPNEFHSPTTPVSKENKVLEKAPGVMNDLKDMEEIKNKILEEDLELDFQENKNVQILSIQNDVLFRQGETELSPKGKALLSRLAVYLMSVDYPLLLAGHSAGMRDEFGTSFEDEKNSVELSPTWLLSLKRVQSVYRFFVSKGVPSNMLQMEAFGKYRPRYDMHRAFERQKNRRVDIVLDKRNLEWAKKMTSLTTDTPVPENFSFKDFEFKLTMPPQPQKNIDQSLGDQNMRGTK